MEIRGICSLCGQSGKMYTCSLCGTIVCGRCYNIRRGICKSCEIFKNGDISNSLR